MDYLLQFTKEEWENFGTKNNFGELIFQDYYQESEAPKYDSKTRMLLTYLKNQNDCTYLYLSDYGVIDMFNEDDMESPHGTLDDRATASYNPQKMIEINKQIYSMIAEKVGEDYYTELLGFRLNRQKNTNHRIQTLRHKIENYTKVVDSLEIRISEQKRAKFAEKVKEKKEQLLYRENYAIKNYTSAIEKYKKSLEKLLVYSEYENELIEYIKSQITNQAELS